jgi:3',5'-cyclic-AMP phosphodiesterase
VRVIAVEEAPFFELPYLAAAPKGGTESRALPFLRVTIEGLSASLLVTSDLQGCAPSNEGPAVLLGEALAQEVVIPGDTDDAATGIT